MVKEKIMEDVETKETKEVINNLIDIMRNSSINLILITKELELLNFKKTITKEELRSKLVELLKLASEMKVTENICLNGLIKL